MRESHSDEMYVSRTLSATANMVTRGFAMVCVQKMQYSMDISRALCPLPLRTIWAMSKWLDGSEKQSVDMPFGRPPSTMTRLA